MTAAVWMAAPPEVHSALLSAGPGPGPLLAAAGSWHALSAAYTEVAAELQAALSTTAAAWEGPTAVSYRAAHLPYLAWLRHAGADSAARATQHEIAATAYLSALATMPTLPELTANHATHAALVATNFFGINTIPIAVNEADYVRMWVQAATTMSAYEATSATALRTAPTTATAPPIVRAESTPAADQPEPANPIQGLLDAIEPILKMLGIENGDTAHNPAVSNALTDAVAELLHYAGIDWDPGAALLNGHPYDYYMNAAEPIWYVARSLELFQNFLEVGQNPAQAVRSLQYLAAVALFDWPTHVAQVITAVSQSPALLLAAAGAGVAPLGAAGGAAGLAGLAGLAPPAAAVTPSPPLDAPADIPPLGAATPAPVGAAAGAPPPSAAPATVPASPAPPGAPPAPVPGVGPPAVVPPLLVGPPRIGFDDSGMATDAGAQRRTREPEAAAAATKRARAAREEAGARRRRRARQREAGAEFMDMNIELDPDWAGPDPAGPTASAAGAGQLGLAGTAPIDDTEAVGLTRMAGDGFDGGPPEPMVPHTWR